jgi:hypothetical protein
VLFVENGDGLESDVANQLAFLGLEKACNEILDLRYALCDPSYRVKTSVTLTIYDVLFRYAVTGKCAAVCGTDSNFFDVLTKEKVLLRVSALAEAFLNGAQLVGLLEIDQVPCSNVVVEFDEVVIVELISTCPDEQDFGFDEALISIIEETFMSTYNRLSGGLYCDEFLGMLF